MTIELLPTQTAESYFFSYHLRQDPALRLMFGYHTILLENPISPLFQFYASTENVAKYMFGFLNRACKFPHQIMKIHTLFWVEVYKSNDDFSKFPLRITTFLPTHVIDYHVHISPSTLLGSPPYILQLPTWSSLVASYTTP